MKWVDPTIKTFLQGKSRCKVFRNVSFVLSSPITGESINGEVFLSIAQKQLS